MNIPIAIFIKALQVVYYFTMTTFGSVISFPFGKFTIVSTEFRFVEISCILILFMMAASKYNGFENEPWFVFQLLNVTFSMANVTGMLLWNSS